MPWSLAHHGRRIRQSLTRLESQPLGKAALLVIIFLDLFILVSLFRGLDAQTRQLPGPQEIIPPLCEDIVIAQGWDAANRLERLAQLLDDPRHQPGATTALHPGLHPICRPLIASFQLIRDDRGLADALNELKRLGQENASLRQRLEQMKGAYDTRLLEKIAGEPAAGTPAEAMRAEMAQLGSRMDEIVASSSALRQQLEATAGIQSFLAELQQVGASERRTLIEARQRLQFWQPVKRLGMELLFLLPLLAAFYFWNSRSLARHRPYQTLVSAHLLAVTMIPVLFELLRLAYDIIPRKLIHRLIGLLESLGLVAIWHYLVMAAGIALALALVYLLQGKLFSAERLGQRRLARGECQGCGLRLPAGSRYCPGCGAAQYRDCPHCGQPTPLHGRYCTACGRESA